jgi:Tfp pilus assembly PilM family ATPase
MIRSSSTILGLAFSDRGVVCAEVATSRGDTTVRHIATFAPPEGVGLDKPDAYGQALASFLRQSKFGASRAAVGVPAKWLVAVERDVPPADDEQARAVLRMHADRMGASEAGELVTDFAGKLDRRTGGKVLLVGILRRQLDKVLAVVEAAGLTPACVTPTAMALASTDPDGMAAPSSSCASTASHGCCATSRCRRRGRSRARRRSGRSAWNCVASSR